MAGSTKLFQRAGSPLIQGRSRYARSFSTDWLKACGVSLVIPYGVLVAITLMDPARPYLTSPVAIVQWLAVPAPGLLAMLPVTASLVWVARRLGWRGAWVFAGVVGGTVALVVMVYAWR